jgi:hypothetical protein
MSIRGATVAVGAAGATFIPTLGIRFVKHALGLDAQHSLAAEREQRAGDGTEIDG